MSVTFNNKEHIYIVEKKTKFKHNIIIDNTNTSNANL